MRRRGYAPLTQLVAAPPLAFPMSSVAVGSHSTSPRFRSPSTRARSVRLEKTRTGPKWATIEIESQCLLGIAEKVDGGRQ